MSEKYFYATDSLSFYDSKNGAKITEKDLEVGLLVSGVPVEGLAQAIMKIIKNGKSYNDHRSKNVKKMNPKQALKSALDQAYLDLKDDIPLLFLNKKDGASFAFRKISKNEVCTIKNLESKSLSSTLLSDDDISDKYRNYYNTFQDIGLNMLLEEFVDELVFRAKVDKEKMIKEEPKFITWNENEIAFKYFNPDILEDGPTPYYDNFCNRLGEGRELFMAWCWSIFEQGNNCRQMIWIQGAGQDGKSTVFNALSSFIGSNHCASLSESEFNNPFFFNDIYGRILSIYGDCHTTNIFENEKIKNITGNDMVTINGKYAQTFKANVYSKVLIGSNQFPQVAWHMTHQSSRIVVLQIQPLKKKGGDSLALPSMIKETPAFLKKCRELYPKYFPTHSDISIPEEYERFMHNTYVSNEMSIIREFCSEEIELGEPYEITRLKVISALKHNFRENRIRVPGDIDIMFEKYVKSLSKAIQGPIAIKKGNGETIGFKGFRLKDPTPINGVKK